MLKTKAIELLGGSIPAAAEAIGISYQAVNQWPDELTDAIRDRVQAVLYRRSIDGTTATSAQQATEAVVQGG